MYAIHMTVEGRLILCRCRTSNSRLVCSWSLRADAKGLGYLPPFLGVWGVLVPLPGEGSDPHSSATQINL